MQKIIDAVSGYAASLALVIQDVNWAMLGGFILFAARASVDIPKAYDYWKERSKRNDKGN